MKIIIAGAGEVGSHLAKMLSEASYDITVIDPDSARLKELAETNDISVVEGRSSSIEVLKRAGAERADLFIAVNPDHSQDVNVVSAILAKQMGSKRVTARINNEEYLAYDNKQLFTELGIDLLFYPEKIAASEIVERLEKTASSDSVMFGRGKLQMEVFRLDEDSPLIDMTVLELGQELAPRFSQTERQFNVVAIDRKGHTIIPGPDTKFRYNDRVYFVAKRDCILVLMDFLGKKDLVINSLMIVGGGPIGEMVARSMKEKLDDVKIIEHKPAKCLMLSEKFGDKVTVVRGDGRNTDLLREESVSSYDAFVAVTSNSEANILACVAAKKNGVGYTVAEIENLDYIRLAEEMGVDAVINKKSITAARIYKFTLSSKVRFIKEMTGTNARILEYNVAPDSKVTTAPVKDLKFPKGAVIGGVIRGSETMIAVGDTQIEDYDNVVVFADPKSVKEVDKFFR